MKIMFIIPRMVGGGAERVISVLANEFVNRKIGVKILMTSGSDMAYKLDDRIEVIQIGERSGKLVETYYTDYPYEKGVSQ